MQLYILRHGQAESQLTTDEARNLTAKGRVDVALSLKSSAEELKSVQVIWASSLVRAQQTAQIAHNFLTPESENIVLKTTDLIVPEADPYVFFKALQATQLQAILVVSHQPFVGQIIDLLCGTYDGFHPMNTSSLACVDCESVAANMGKLRWLRHVNG
ncbi:MAG: phosphohistidine phosphatase SixA [Pseudomonadota bacterium]